MDSVSVFGIIIIILQLICLILEITYYKDGEMEKGLLMNLLIVVLLVIWHCIK